MCSLIYGLISKANPLVCLSKNGTDGLVVAVQAYSSLLGKVVVLFSYCLVPVTAVWAFRTRNVLLLCFLTSVLYSAAIISVLANAESRFASSQYAFHLCNFVVGLSLIGGFAARRLGFGVGRA